MNIYGDDGAGELPHKVRCAFSKSPNHNNPRQDLIRVCHPVMPPFDHYAWEFTSEFPPKVSYGFNNMYQGVFKDRQEFETDIIDVKNPDHTPAAERRRLREEDEDDKMAEDHGQYLFDTLMNQEMIEPVIAYKAPWERWVVGRFRVRSIACILTLEFPNSSSIHDPDLLMQMICTLTFVMCTQ
jgi:hypothetical protein